MSKITPIQRENIAQKELGQEIERAIKITRKRFNLTPVDIAGVFRGIELKYFFKEETK